MKVNFQSQLFPDKTYHFDDSAQKKFTDAELMNIRSELDEILKNTPANRIINAVGFSN